MVIAHDFAYVRPASLDAALAALAAADGEVRVLAGGTDVVPWLRDDAIAPRLLVDIKRIPGLDRIEWQDGRVTLGALVTFSDLLGSSAIAERLPMLHEMAHEVASVGIRNRATIVGNLCSAVPSLDAGPALLVYDATVHVAGKGWTRDVPLADWFVGPRRTRIRRGELVTRISLEVPPGASGAAFLKLSRYRGEDLAQANLAVVVRENREYRIAFGAVGPVPRRAERIEQLLAGRSLTDELVAAAVALVPTEISPITDVRAGAEYRARMCGVMLRRGLDAATARCSGSGPPYPSRLM